VSKYFGHSGKAHSACGAGEEDSGFHGERGVLLVLLSSKTAQRYNKKRDCANKKAHKYAE
jgi:hypothetical protein